MSEVVRFHQLWGPRRAHIYIVFDLLGELNQIGKLSRHIWRSLVRHQAVRLSLSPFVLDVLIVPGSSVESLEVLHTV